MKRSTVIALIFLAVSLSQTTISWALEVTGLECLDTSQAKLRVAEQLGTGLHAARSEFLECVNNADRALITSLSTVPSKTDGEKDLSPQLFSVTPGSVGGSSLEAISQAPVTKLLELQAAANAAEQAIKLAQAKEQAAAIEKRQEDEEQFLGFNWGLGVGASFGLGADRIESAEVVNGVVRVSEEVTNTPRIVLEVHNFLNQYANEIRTFGHGPFAAVNFGASDAGSLTAFGGGYMWGWRRNDSSGSFNIGLGLMLDRGVQQLGDDIEDGMSLPEGETDVRFKKDSELAALLFFSTTFD